MISRKSLFCLFIFFVASTYALNTVPDYLHVCHQSDEKLAECMTNSIDFLKPLLAVGIPELDIPTIEPLALGDLLVSERTTSNGLQITATNIQVYGASNFKIKKLMVVKYGETYHFDIYLPTLYCEGDYNINGNILLLPIKGNGKFTGNFTTSIGSVKVNFNKSGEYMSVKTIDIKIKTGAGKIFLQNLFNGDKVLGDAINEVLNQNFDVLIQDMIPLVERALQRVFKKISNKIGSRFTYAQLFPLD